MFRLSLLPEYLPVAIREVTVCPRSLENTLKKIMKNQNVYLNSVRRVINKQLNSPPTWVEGSWQH